MRLERLYAGLRASDGIVAKALALSEVAQIAKAEQRLREYVYKVWSRLAAQATDKAAQLASQGKSAKQIAAAVDAIMDRWATEVRNTYLKEFEAIYRLARRAGRKKALRRTSASLQYDVPNYTEQTAPVAKATYGIEPSFDLADKAAMEALKDHQLFWIGDHYETGVSSGVADTAKKVMVEAGGDEVKAGKLMREKMAKELAHVATPKGFHGTDKQYFEMLTANAATVARAHGQMRSFMDIGVSKYQIVNPGDERTCPVCKEMDGRVFLVKEGAGTMHKELAAKTPDDVRKAHPWTSAKGLKAVIGGKSGVAASSALSSAGLNLPPFHGRCRCTVDIDDDIGSFDDMEELSPPTSDEEAAPIEPTRVSIADRMAKATIDKLERMDVDSANVTSIAHMTDEDGNKLKAVLKYASGEDEGLRMGIKAGTYYKREVLTSELDAMLGGEQVVPATIVRKHTDGIGSLQYFEEAERTQYMGNRLHANAAKVANDPTARKMFLIDVVGGNSDRHYGNALWQEVEVAGAKRIKTVAIDNGLLFSNRDEMSFMFPFYDDAYQDVLLKLDKDSIAMLRDLDMKKYVKLLHKNGIERDATLYSMRRIEALKSDPDILYKQYESGFGDSQKSAVTKFISHSVKRPDKLGISDSEDEALEKIINSVYGEP
jgi:SPP1 gp7 family putative phage head morphogenesis protein